MRNVSHLQNDAYSLFTFANDILRGVQNFRLLQPQDQKTKLEELKTFLEENSEEIKNLLNSLEITVDAL